MKVKVIDNFLDEEVIDELNDLSIDSQHLGFENSERWQNTLNTGYGKVGMYSLYNISKPSMFHDIVDPIIELFKNEHNLETTSIDFYYWNKDSLINFHNDNIFDASATLYLNADWDHQWGGFFIWDKEEKDMQQQMNEGRAPHKFEAVAPIRNRCVINKANVQHAVTPVINVPDNFTRRTVQFRFNNL